MKNKTANSDKSEFEKDCLDGGNTASISDYEYCNVGSNFVDQVAFIYLRTSLELEEDVFGLWHQVLRNHPIL